MAPNSLQAVFARINRFGWNNAKRERNLRLHKIDFVDATRVIDGPFLALPSDRNNETRYQIFGYVDDREISVACTLREDVCWIISARPAHRSERKRYFGDLARHATQRRD